MDEDQDRRLLKAGECLDKAAHCERQAANVTDPVVRASLIEAALHWREAARAMAS